MANSRILSALPALLLLAGCPVYGSEPVQRGVLVSCQTDFDCPSDAYCDWDSNECVSYDFGICLTDGDCPVGENCTIDPLGSASCIVMVAASSCDWDRRSCWSR